METRVKCFTFARRAPDIDASEFGKRWRQQAEDLFTRAPSGVRPSEAIYAVARRSRRGDAAYDGVAITWYADADARKRWIDWCAADQPPEPAVAIVDVQGTETVEVNERVVFGEDVLTDRRRGRPRESSVLVVGIFERKASLTRDQFADYWWGEHRPLANRLLPSTAQPEAYVHNYVVAADPSSWDGIAEMYEASVDAARQRGAWMEGDAARPLMADEDEFLVRDTRKVLVTDYEVLLR